VPKSTKQILIDAKALIDTPEKWCKGHFTIYASPLQHCTRGAVTWAGEYNRDNCGSRESTTETWLARILLEKSVPNPRLSGNIIAYNDLPETTHQDIMTLFDNAIKKAGGLEDANRKA